MQSPGRSDLSRDAESIVTDDASSGGQKEDDEDDEEDGGDDEKFEGFSGDPERLKAFNVSSISIIHQHKVAEFFCPGPKIPVLNAEFSG